MITFKIIEMIILKSIRNFDTSLVTPRLILKTDEEIAIFFQFIWAAQSDGVSEKLLRGLIHLKFTILIIHVDSLILNTRVSMFQCNTNKKLCETQGASVD